MIARIDEVPDITSLPRFIVSMNSEVATADGRRSWTNPLWGPAAAPG